MCQNCFCAVIRDEIKVIWTWSLLNRFLHISIGTQVSTLNVDSQQLYQGQKHQWYWEYTSRLVQVVLTSPWHSGHCCGSWLERSRVGALGLEAPSINNKNFGTIHFARGTSGQNYSSLSTPSLIKTNWDRGVSNLQIVPSDYRIYYVILKRKSLNES